MNFPKVDVKKILYATDLSENARFAYAYAVSLAELYGAQITLMHVLPELSELMDKHILGYIDADRWEKIKAQHFDEAREALIGKRQDHLAVRDVLQQFSENAAESEGVGSDQIIVERGNPVKKIIEHADNEKFDLIVMGTHGHGKLEDAMIGSTARRVVRRSKIPVLVVRLPEADD